MMEPDKLGFLLSCLFGELRHPFFFDKFPPAFPFQKDAEA